MREINLLYQLAVICENIETRCVVGTKKKRDVVKLIRAHACQMAEQLSQSASDSYSTSLEFGELASC